MKQIRNMAALLLVFFVGEAHLHAQPQDFSPSFDLSLCITQVLRTHPDMGMSRDDIDRDLSLTRSVRKDRYPSLSAHYSYAHQPDSLTLPPDQFAYGVVAEQPLYRGGALVTAVKQAEISLEASRLQLRSTINNLAYETSLRYYDVLRAAHLADEAKQALLRLQSHVKDARAFYEAGLIPKNDLLQSEVELAQGEQDMVNADNGLALAQARLNILMQRNADAPLSLVQEEGATLLDTTWKQVLQSALSNRPEIDQSSRLIHLAENDIVLKKAPYLPSVTLSASYERIGEDPTGAPYDSVPSEVKTVMATASWNFWAWNKGQDEVVAAKSRLRRAEKEADRLVNEITLEARNAFLMLEQAAKRITVAEKSIEHAKENYRINQAQYQAQLATSTNVLDAQTLLTRAMTNYYDAIYGYRQAAAAVEKAMGVYALRFHQDEQ